MPESKEPYSVASQDPEVAALWQFHQHVIPFNLDWIHLHAHAYILIRCTCLRIKSPAMPGTDYLAIQHYALTKWAAPVTAHIFHCRVAAIDLGNADRRAVHFELLGFAIGRKLCFCADLHEISHSGLL